MIWLKIKPPTIFSGGAKVNTIKANTIHLYFSSIFVFLQKMQKLGVFESGQNAQKHFPENFAFFATSNYVKYFQNFLTN